MAESFSSTFTYMYQLTGGSAGDTIKKQVHVLPDGTSNVTVTDTSKTSQNGTLTPAANDTFAVTHAGAAHNGTYAYIGSATGGFVGYYDGHYYLVTNTPQTEGASVTINTNPATGTTYICFMAGTGILTPDGSRPVEALKAGDLVCTRDGGAAPVRWVGRQTVSMLFADRVRALPVRIKAGALADDLPSRDLLVSPDHAILVDGVLMQAGALVNGLSILREADVPGRFTYYHVELANHALLLAEGVAAESFIDNVERMAFDNWAEHEALAVEPGSMNELDLPRAKSHRQVPPQTRQRLHARAVALFPADLDAVA